MRAPLRFFPTPPASVSAIVVPAAAGLFFVGLHWVYWVLVTLFVIEMTFDALTASRR